MRTSPQLAVVFRGTDGWNDWFSNLRWFFWLTRFIPRYEDQYHMVSRMVGHALKRSSEGKRCSIPGREGAEVGVDRTFGGGLPSISPTRCRLTIASRESRTLYAFDPSPVTGWSTVDTTIREK